MVKVKPKKGESQDSLINRFKKMTADIVREARENKYHKTDAEKRKEERQRKEYRDYQKRQRTD